MGSLPDAVPVLFAAPRRLRALNVIALAASLAACTSAVMMGAGVLGLDWGLYCGAPTFVVGAVWAIVLRWNARVSPWGWVASIPLAAANAGLAMGLDQAVDMGGTLSQRYVSFQLYAAVGATFGVFIWLPALVGVLVVFGIPIGYAQYKARLGLAGEERGERIVAVVAAALGVVALAIAVVMRLHAMPMESGPMLAALGRAVFFVHVASAIACGVGAAAWATVREQRRRRFVERVEAGEEPGFRVEETHAGKVLRRVASSATYRAPETSEAVAELDRRHA